MTLDLTRADERENVIMFEALPGLCFSDETLGSKRCSSSGGTISELGDDTDSDNVLGLVIPFDPWPLAGYLSEFDMGTSEEITKTTVQVGGV